jgi:hypothetical protein
MPDTVMKDYDSPTHWMIERYARGHGKTACGIVMRNCHQ